MNNEIKVLSGIYKGKKIKVLNKEGLRPTTSIIKDSIFCFLKDKVVNANILDLFAGTGALALESLSYRAKSAHIVELDKQIYSNLQSTFKDIKGANLYNIDALLFLQKNKQKFDIIFLDPPYMNSKIINECIELILKGDMLEDDGIIYIETSSIKTQIFKGLECIFKKQVGACYCAFYKKSSFI